MVGTIGVGREVAPRIVEGQAYAPAVRARIVDVDFVGRIGRHSASTHHIHPAVEVKRTRLACCSRYVGNRADSIRDRVIDKGVRSIGQSAGRRWDDIGASTRLDEVANCRRGYVAARNRQNSSLLYPGGRRSKLPDLAGRGHRDGLESA